MKTTISPKIYHSSFVNLLSYSSHRLSLEVFFSNISGDAESWLEIMRLYETDGRKGYKIDNTWSDE